MRNYDTVDRESGNRTDSDGWAANEATPLLESPADTEQSSDGSEEMLSRRPSVVTFGETTTAIIPQLSSSSSDPSSVGNGNNNGNLTVATNNNNDNNIPSSSCPQFPFRVPAVSLAVVQRSLRLRPDCESVSLEEHYYHLLVAQEERHRSQTPSYCTRHNTLYMIMTVVALCLFGACMTMCVGMCVDAMSSSEQVMFAVSLVATAAVSESDKLLRVVARRARGTGRGRDKGHGRRSKR